MSALMSEEKRHAYVDLTNVVMLLVETEGPPGIEMELAKKGGELVQKILGEHGDLIDGAYVADLPDEVFAAAVDVAQGMGAAAMAVGEEISTDAFDRRVQRILSIRGRPDPSVAAEFI